jgi:FkbM family methyltransferase
VLSVVKSAFFEVPLLALSRLRSRLSALRWQLADTWREAKMHAREFVSWKVARRLAYSRWMSRGDSAKLWPLNLPGFAHPIYYRQGTSDVLVLRQVLAGREYDCVAHEPGVTTLFDLGGNIGAATFFLLHYYPEARVVFVEPDSGNLRVAQATLAPWAGQVTFVQAGVWDQSVGLNVERGQYRDGGEWAFQVRPVRPDETADLQGVTINDLLTQSGFDRIDLMKIDIEAAEETVFQGDTSFLARTKTLAIELHGPSCEAAVEAAVGAYPHMKTVVGETAIYRFRHLPGTYVPG